MEKGLSQFLKVPIVYDRAKNKNKNNGSFLKKIPNWLTDRQTGRQTGNGDFIAPSVVKGSYIVIFRTAISFVLS